MCIPTPRGCNLAHREIVRVITTVSIELRVQSEILFKEDNSQRQIVKKLKISRHEVQYLLQRQLETSANFDRKRAGTPKVATGSWI